MYVLTKSLNLLIIMFLCFGLYAIANPNGISKANLEKSYTVTDLIRGWGIYAVTIGALLLYPQSIKSILILCFLASIIWHWLISIRKGWTSHHKQSILINLFAVLLVSECWKFRLPSSFVAKHLPEYDYSFL